MVKKACLLSNTETYNGCLMLHNCPLVLEQADDLSIHRFLPQTLDGVLWAATQQPKITSLMQMQLGLDAIFQTLLFRQSLRMQNDPRAQVLRPHPDIFLSPFFKVLLF
jgi:hypothetical protein